MSGISIHLDGVVVTGGLVIRKDNRLNAGSLVLLAPEHSTYGITSTANGATIPNVAMTEAKINLGLANESTVNAFSIVNTLTSGSGFVEITPKKGIHVVKSQVNDISGSVFRINIPTPIADYIFDNIANGFFVSTWYKNTRLSTSSSTADLLLNVNTTSNLILAQQRGSFLPAGLTNKLDPTNALGAYRANAFINAKTGSPTKSSGQFYKVGSAGAFSEINTGPSKVLYMLYIEDLSKSGRTYAEANAADLALFNTYFGTGGKFNGDTNTSPSTLP